jgi:hypothetical protein
MYKIHDLDFTYPVDPQDFKKINCYRVEYDENGLIIKAVFLKDGKPAMDIYNELSGIEIRYSENNEKWYYRDLEGKSTVYNVEYESYNFDSTGTLLSCTNCSKDGRIVEDTSGVATYLYSTDSLNNVLTEVFLNIAGDTILTTRGYYKAVFKYDNSNNVIEMANYDKNERLLSDVAGIAMVRYKYDEKNNRLEFIFYDDRNNITYHKDLKISKVKHIFDLNGNIIQVEDLDENGNLVFNDSLGFAYYEMKYNNGGDKIEQTNYNSQDLPLLNRKFNELGIVTEEIVYADYRRFRGLENEDYDYCLTKYDDKGKSIEYRFFNSDNTLHQVSQGYAIVKYKRNGKGDILETQFFDADSNLISKSTR